MEKITDEIFVSGKTTKADVEHHKIKYCINIANVPVEFKVDKNFPIADDYANNPERFIKILECIDKQIKAKNTPILVMCRGGISRSPTIVALYLFYNHTFPGFSEALEYVGKKSSLISPNLNLTDFIREKVIPLFDSAKG